MTKTFTIEGIQYTACVEAKDDCEALNEGDHPTAIELTYKAETPLITDETPVNLQVLYPGGGSPIYIPMTFKEAKYHVEVAAKRTSAAVGTAFMCRAFEVLEDGERFITAWIVDNGAVTEHPDVTIPKRFF